MLLVNLKSKQFLKRTCMGHYIGCIPAFVLIGVLNIFCIVDCVKLFLFFLIEALPVDRLTVWLVISTRKELI